MNRSNWIKKLTVVGSLGFILYTPNVSISAQTYEMINEIELLKDDELEILNEYIKKMGYSTDDLEDSVKLDEIESKVRNFQNENNIKNTNILNEETILLMEIDNSKPKKDELLINEKSSVVEIRNEKIKILEDGVRHKRVITLKQNLKKLGFPVPGKGTELYGPKTATKVREFQEYYGLSVTGKTDEHTETKVHKVANTPLQNGQRHKNTIQLKKDLKTAGFEVPGKGTNLYGDQTSLKVSQFQKKYNLIATGIADEVTLKKLQEVVSKIENPEILEDGVRHGRVITLKQSLKKLGFPVPGKGTELYGPKTATKVREFQEYYGLSVTGKADEHTESKVHKVANTPLQNGQRHKDTIQLKKDLKIAGFEVLGKGTDLYGDQTSLKVSQFQKKYNLIVTGIADEVTLKKLKEVVSKIKNPEILEDGVRHERVITLKQNLKKLGFPVPGKGTELYGPKTATKVREFQEYYGLSVTGKADEHTETKVHKVANTHLQNGQRHKDTIQLKEDLKTAGFEVPGKGTDLYGDQTSLKVSQFQKKYNLIVTGIADEVTLKKLQEVVDKIEDLKPTIKTEYTDYSLSLDEAVLLQLRDSKPHTDKYRHKDAYILSSQVKNGKILSETKVHSDTNIISHVYGTLVKNQSVKIVEISNKDWYKIEYQAWRQPTISDLKTAMDPDTGNKYQHLRLDTLIGAKASELNKMFRSDGILSGKGQYFINGAKNAKINEAYLIAHSILETGNGTSRLARGIEVGIDNKGNKKLVTDNNRKSLKNIKTVYNMFGIGAFTGTAEESGAIRAYELGWFSPETAIEDGAMWIGEGYIYNEYDQNTIYKMRWNPKMHSGSIWKQYASDMSWANKQVDRIIEVYQHIENPNLHFDIVRYK